MLTDQVNYTTALHARAVRGSPDRLDQTGDIETHNLRIDTKDLLAFQRVLMLPQMACMRSAAQSIAFLLFLASILLGCARKDSAPPVASLVLRSSSFAGDTIPAKYQGSREDGPCDGQDISPELSWGAPPEHTQSFALIVTDKDSPFGFNFVHWVIYDLPPDRRELVEGTARQGVLPDGSRQGFNGFDKIGYAGPCPPGHSPHHYVFSLYALNTKLNLPPGASKKKVVEAMKGHVMAKGELIAKYQH